MLSRTWLISLAAALALGVAGGVLITVLHASSPSATRLPSNMPAAPDATWAAGAKPAPDFSLTDQAGKPVTIAAFHGRPVIVTFIDPLCRNLCPLEAKVLDQVVSRLPASSRPAILAVSVDQWGNKRRYLLEDVKRWKLPPQWHWAVGSPAALKKVWAGYQIAVKDAPKKVAGVLVHNISHTEAAFFVDPRGYQRALYLWPFRAPDVERTIRQLAGAPG